MVLKQRFLKIASTFNFADEVILSLEKIKV
jgi:hypothetical protein